MVNDKSLSINVSSILITNFSPFILIFLDFFFIQERRFTQNNTRSRTPRPRTAKVARVH
jgi:hypothetical protein